MLQCRSCIEGLRRAGGYFDSEEVGENFFHSSAWENFILEHNNNSMVGNSSPTIILEKGGQDLRQGGRERKREIEGKRMKRGERDIFILEYHMIKTTKNGKI